MRHLALAVPLSQVVASPLAHATSDPGTWEDAAKNTYGPLKRDGIDIDEPSDE